MAVPAVINFTMGAPLGIVRIDEIEASYEFLSAREKELKDSLEALATVPHEDLKSWLIGWAKTGMETNFPIVKLKAPEMPKACSDGQLRENLDEYILYSSGNTLQAHVRGLQNRMVGIKVTYALIDNFITIMVSKADTP